MHSGGLGSFWSLGGSAGRGGAGRPVRAVTRFTDGPSPGCWTEPRPEGAQPWRTIMASDLKQQPEPQQTATPTDGQLSEEQLENIAGGADNRYEYYKVTFQDLLASG